MMRYPISGSFTIFLDSVVHYFLCLRSFKASFSLFACSWWRMVLARRGFVFPLAPGLLDQGWRSIERAGRYLDGFSHSFGCTYSTGGIFLYLIKTYKLQKFKPSHHCLLRVCPQFSYPSIFPPTYLLTSHAYPSPILNLPITFNPLSRQYHPPDAITITTP